MGDTPQPKFKLNERVIVGGCHTWIEFAQYQNGWHYGMAGWPCKWFPEDMVDADPRVAAPGGARDGK